MAGSRNTKQNTKCEGKRGNSQMSSKRSSNRKSKRNSNWKNDAERKFNPATATNDPAWYGADPNLLRDSASLPFSYAVGMPIDLHNPGLTQLPNGQKFTIPGFMSFRLKPSVGFADDASDPINTAAFRMYTFVRHLNSGHVNYDAPDLMLYILAMSQVYSYINFLQRAYGVIYTYSQKNRYMPNALLEAMDIDPADVRSNLASFRYGINVLINKAASLCVPATMSLLSRHSSVYQNLYIEGESLKEQMYFYTPESFWKYTLASDASGMLEDSKFFGVADHKHTVAELLDYGNDMLARLIMSEDMNIMSGDIRKAYGDNLIKLQPLGVDFPITPIYDHAVLQQMKNTIVIQYAVDGFDITQDSTHGYLVHKPYAIQQRKTGDWLTAGMSYMLQTLTEDKILSVNSAEPTPEEVMESSRGIPYFSGFTRDDTKATLYIHACADVAVKCDMFAFTMQGDTPTLKPLRLAYVLTPSAVDEASNALTFKILAWMGHFKYHPMVHIIPLRQGSTGDTFTYSNSEFVYDVDNYTILSSTTIERMNEAALLSMLNVPVVAKVQ